jgi:coproporphyrinogen III oxidase
MSTGDATQSIEAQAERFFREVQDTICAGLETAEGRARFHTDRWERPGGGGGITRVIADGDLFEKGGVNTSVVHGQLKPEFAAQLPGDGLEFFATGISLVLHPQNPHVPTVHANFRCIRRGKTRWFGGGADLTPYYPVLEDAVHFLRTG